MTKHPAQPLRAVVYVRLSSHRGDADPSTSPARQEQSCRAYCEAKGWTVVDVVKDLDVSGSDKGARLDRPGLRAIRERWADVDVVIFGRLDRLARNVIDFRTFADEAAEHDAALVSVAESLDLTTPSGRFVATILAAFAEMEAATIAARTLDGIDGTRRLGRWAGGNPPYGMKIVAAPDGPGFVLAPDPDTAPIVREIADAVLSGTPLYRVAQDLNARGILTQVAALAAAGRTKRPPSAWSATTLRRLLTNPAMIGRSLHRGEVLRDETGLPRRVWEPVLPEADWRRLRALLAPASGRSTAAPGRPGRLLTGGLARCGRCDRPLYATSRTLPDGGTRPFYACSAKRNGYPCDGVAIGAEALETYVADYVLSLVGAWPVVEAVTIAVDDGRRADVEAAIADFARRMTEPGADIPALASRLAALHAERDALPATAPTETRRVPTGLTFRQTWDARDTDGRRALLAGNVEAVRVRSGVRGRRGFDPARVVIDMHEHAEEID
jgi:DNA invertase Pin-like site-specific DNA recombinase